MAQSRDGMAFWYCVWYAIGNSYCSDTGANRLIRSRNRVVWPQPYPRVI